jgi:ribosomal protein S18 acetylase RimI-like enzyme
MSGVTLRPLTAKEYDALRGPALAEFTADLARAEHRPVDDALRSRGESFFPPTLDEALAEPGAHILRLLDDSGTEVGLLWLGRASGSTTTGFVYDVAVDAEHRGRGLGRAAMLAAEERFRGEGCTHIALNVFGGNEPAERLYRSLGFEVDATQLSKPLQDPS